MTNSITAITVSLRKDHLNETRIIIRDTSYARRRFLRLIIRPRFSEAGRFELRRVEPFLEDLDLGFTEYTREMKKKRKRKGRKKEKERNEENDTSLFPVRYYTYLMAHLT